jgi:hypothetical protein
MPAVRDFSQGYHSTTTYKHVLAPIPTYAEGDLLLGIVSIDDSAASASQDVVGGRRCGYVFYNDDTGGTPAWTDYSSQAGDESTADWYPSPTAPTVNDCIYFGDASKFVSVKCLASTQGAATSVPVWAYEYWNGSTWTTLSTTTNTLTDWRFATTVHAEAIFTAPSDWATTTVNSQSAYWIRARCTTAGTYTTRPVMTQAWLIPLTDGKKAWRQLFKYYSGTTPAPLTVVWKIAEATEYDPAFFYTTAETADVEVISIRDVQVFADSGPAALTVNCNATNGTYIRTTGSWATDGFAVGMQILPSGNASAANNRVRQIQSITTTTNANDTITVTNSTNMVTESGSGDERIIAWPFSSNIAGGGSGATYDGYNTSNDNTYRSNLPTVTTTKDDCLLIWAAAPDAVSVPSIIEGPCNLIAGKDGAAHADGMAWGYQKTAGTTPNNVYVSKMSALVTEMCVIAVNPPHGGATARPTYGVSDASAYINPLTGTAFGSDSAPVNTLTTPFTGTINGRPVANGGTTYSRADSGINSYHAIANFTGLTTSGTWSGVRNTIASRNLSGKNLLFHIQPYLPLDIQTTNAVTDSGVCGVAIGLASSNGNYKVWHVGGRGVYGDTLRFQPVVIHTSATAGLLQTTGTLSDTAVVDLGFLVSGKTVAPNWLICSMWALDNFVVVGGIAAEPITIPDIVKTYADSHERRSAIQQGAKQALFLGPVQIGDGTNFTYLLLDGTAIEFPRQYNKALKQVFYNSIDNVCGLKYKAAAGDTIIHRNSLISSGSRYFWGLDSAFSTSVTPDFSGLSVIGAGTITLARAITISGLTINDYSTLDISNATLSGCTIKNPPSSNDSVTTNASTTVSGCIIDVSSVASGNRWLSTATPNKFSGCSFIGGGGHALRITATGTYTLNANTFTGFGADGSNGAAIYNDSGGAVTLNITGGGSTPTVRNGTSASTTVNNNKVLTLTGLQDGSDIVILTAGTTTERVNIDANSGTTYQFSYAYTASDYVDIQVFKAGYVPFIVRSYLLPNADGSLPIAQVVDRYYIV